MRIAILNNASGSVGGAARIAGVQEELLKKRGHEVQVFSSSTRWFQAPAFVRLRHHLRDLDPKASIVHQMISWKPDTLITHNLTGCGFRTPRTIKRAMSRMRWIHVLHDVQLFEPSGQMRSERITPWQMIWGWLRRRALGTPDLILSPTAWLLQEHRRRHFFEGAHAHVLPNPCPLSLLEHPADFRSVPMRDEHRPVRLLYVGRISEDKGSGVLVDVARSLQRPFELHVIGAGPDTRRLCDASPSVICHGELPPDQVEDRMRASDVLLVPSLIEENQPTVILEAARLALPVIATKKGGIPETLQQAGILIEEDAETHQPWINAIEFLRHPITYGEYVARMDALAARYDPNAYVQRLEALLTLNV